MQVVCTLVGAEDVNLPQQKPQVDRDVDQPKLLSKYQSEVLIPQEREWQENQQPVAQPASELKKVRRNKPASADTVVGCCRC